MARTRMVTIEFVKDYFRDRRFGFIINPGGGMNLYVESQNPDDDKQRFEQALAAESALYQTALHLEMLHSLETCEFLTVSDIEQDDYVQRVLEQKSTTPPRLHLNRWLQPTAPASPGKAKRITFYSYKGGVGRSTALVFVAICLARAGKRVVLVDFDLEAPGLNSMLLDEASFPPKGVVDYLLEKPDLGEDLSAEVLQRLYLAQPHGFDGSANIHVMPAGHLSGGLAHLQGNSNYLEKLSYLDIDILERSSVADQKIAPLAALFRDIEAATEPDYILIDSRTGLADVGGSLLFQYSDLVISLLYNHPQHLVGAQLLMNSLASYKRAGLPCPPVLWVHSLLRHHPATPEGREFHKHLSMFLDQSYQQYSLHPDTTLGLVLDSSEKASAPEHILRLETLEQLNLRSFHDDRLLGDYQRLANRIEGHFLITRDPQTASQMTAVDKNEVLEQLDAKHFANNWSTDLLLADSGLRESLGYPVLYADKSLIPIMVNLLASQETVIEVPPLGAQEVHQLSTDSDWTCAWAVKCLAVLQQWLPQYDQGNRITDFPNGPAPGLRSVGSCIRLLDQADRRLTEAGVKVTLVFPDPDMWLQLPIGALRGLVALFVSRPQASLSARIFVPDPNLLVGLGSFGRRVHLGTAVTWSAIVLSGLARLSPRLEEWMKNVGELRTYRASHGGLYVHDQQEEEICRVMASLFGDVLDPRLPRLGLLNWMNRHVRLPGELPAFTCFRVLTQAISLGIAESTTDQTVYLASPELIRRAWRDTCEAWFSSFGPAEQARLASQLSLSILSRALTPDDFSKTWGADVSTALRTMVGRAVANSNVSQDVLQFVEPVWYGLGLDRI